MAGDAPHILIIRRRYLGDIVLLGSLLRNLKLHWPAARLAVLCEPAYAPILELNPDANERWHFPQSAAAWPGFLWRVRRAGFTQVIDLDNRDKTAVITRATGAPVRLTQRHGEEIHFPSFYTHHEVLPPEFLAQRHITDLYLHPLEKLGVPIVTRECRLVPRADELARARTLLGGARLLLHPGSRSAWRVWPPENFARVIDTIQREHGITTAILAGPGEQQTVDAIFQHLRSPAIRIAKKLSVTELAALFAAAPALLCHDSGPMHIAAAVGTRVIALFGSQPMNIWMPVGERHITLQPPLPCVNCVSPGQCTPDDSYHNHCVRNITPDRVLAAVRSSLVQ
jgi:ADP-heptose:LPS heptosyltransferase